MVDVPEPEGADRLRAVHNESAKLTATYLNGVAIALLAVGTLSPIVASPASAAPPSVALLQGGIGLVCLIGSVGLHYRARAVLRRLR